MADSAKPSNKRKRVVLTITQKLDIIRRLERGENKQDLMRKFNIGSSTIYDIKLQKDKLMKFASSAETSKASDERRTLQQPQHEKLDIILYDWFLLKREEGIPISGPMLMEKARDFSEKLNIAKEYDEEFKGFRCKKSELTDIMEALKNGCTKNLSLTQLEMPDIEIWINVDKNIPVTETLTEEELIRKMTASEEETNDISSESDDEKSSDEKISWGEAEKSLSTFLQFCEKNAQYSVQEVMELHLIKERFMKKRELSFKQTDIRNVFRRMCGATAEAQSKEK
ncbi:Jerky protein [Araneus ventricosus]|uniref:Jerky protein n=1 Tax=Araneus ventricosus TaxID=182803 RepID=A0A4Y2H6P0_ARAVE|nr:Jerky protein [Araneus ventricosus]